MEDEKFTTTSGKEVIIHFNDEGTPTTLTFNGVEISANEIFEIEEYLESLEEE